MKVIKNMKKTTMKKISGILIIAIALATIGAVIVSAETEDTDDTENEHMPFEGKGHMFGKTRYYSELTDEQQDEIDSLLTSLEEEGASFEEIQEAINDKLDEMGILDEHLDSEIERTEQRLSILYRKDELREQGYSWEEIDEIIQEEFDLDCPMEIDHSMMPDRGFNHKHRGFKKFDQSEEDEE